MVIDKQGMAIGGRMGEERYSRLIRNLSGKYGRIWSLLRSIDKIVTAGRLKYISLQSIKDSKGTLTETNNHPIKPIVMKELEQSPMLVSVNMLEEICKPYVEKAFFTIVYRGEVIFNEYLGRWVYDKSKKISDEKIGYFGSVFTKSEHYLNEFWSVEKAQEEASKHSLLYTRKKGIWYEHFDQITLKHLERKLFEIVYLSEKSKQHQ